LKWVVLDYSKENGYLIWADTAADVMEFDKADESSSKNIYGSNKWETSDVRNWLNGQFKSGFGKGEASVINKVKLKNMIAFNRTDEKAGGTKPYYWTALTPYVEQNYDTDAYFNYSEEEIFLLDTSQLKKYVYNKSIKVKKMYGTTNERYWLRTPYFSSESMVRVVDRDGYVYHKDADVKAGVVPAMYLKDTIKCAGGDGTEYNPYKIITEENDGGLPDK
jgi:hypothetical protein